MARLAQFSGICPCCSKYIRANQSMVECLPHPIRPRTSDGVHSDDDGGMYHYNGARISMHPRRWVHKRCYDRWVRENLPAAKVRRKKVPS